MEEAPVSENPAGSVEASVPSSAGTLGLPAAVALIMGSIVGTGIFALPLAIAQYGMIGLVRFLGATVGAIALALIFASLSRLIPFSLHDKRRAYRFSVATRTLLTRVASSIASLPSRSSPREHPGQAKRLVLVQPPLNLRELLFPRNS
jgi:uncharacterized membrane protein required for colicin V production